MTMIFRRYNREDIIMELLRTEQFKVVFKNLVGNLNDCKNL